MCPALGGSEIKARWRSRVAGCGLALIMLGTASCRSPTPPAHPMRWARAWINSVNSQRVEQLLPLLGTTGTFEDSLSGQPLAGELVAYYFTTWWQAFPRLHFTLQRVTGDAQVVAIEWEASGFGDAKAPPIEGVFVLQLRDDAIGSVRGYYNAGPVLFPTAR